MENIKILFVHSHTCKESSYIGTAISYMNFLGAVVNKVPVSEYFSFDDSGYDCLIYNTFANEDYRQKFNREEVLMADEKFHKFPGKKILLDSHDGGTLDGFARFADKKTPRIKLTPGYKFMEEYNVVVPATIRTWWTNIYRGEEKTIPIMYSSRKKHSLNNIRQVINERLKPFNPHTEWIPSVGHYGRLLKSSKISIGAPGMSGAVGRAHNDALAAKAVLFSHDSIKEVKLLPFGELIDDYNYVSFNLDNLEERLSKLLKDEERIKFIAENGYNLFKKGYSPKKTGKQILEFIMK